MQRRCGLSSRQKPQPLLSRIGGKSTLKAAKPLADDAPPMSTDDEDSEVADEVDNRTACIANKIKGVSRASRDQGGLAILDSSDGSGDERAAHVNIRQTTFGRSAQGAKKKRARDPTGLVDNVESDITEKDDSSGNIKRSRPSSSSSAYGRNQASSTAPTSSGEHLKNDLGFTKHKSTKFTYQRRKTAAQKQDDKDSVTPEPKVKKSKYLPTVPGPKAGSKSKIRIPKRLKSPERTGANTLRIPEDPDPSPPPESPPRKRLNLTHKDDEEMDKLLASPEKKKGKLKVVDALEDEQVPAKKAPKRGLKKSKKPELLRSPSPPRAVFKLPASFSELGFGTRSSQSGPDVVLSDVSSGDEDQGPGSASPEAQVVGSTETTCPWCGQAVDKQLFETFSRGKRMNVRMQAAFCKKHRKQTALETWRVRGYPDVEWRGLDGRFAAHRGLLLDIINGKPSYFRDIMARNIESGLERRLKEDECLHPGYYGPRGLNAMGDYLVEEFGELLKQKAVDDRVIAGRGSAAFIQTVLVAELAVQLIKDDMGVSAEQARVILEESKDLGNIVHEEA